MKRASQVGQFELTVCSIIVNNSRFVCTSFKLIDLVKHHFCSSQTIVCNYLDATCMHMHGKKRRGDSVVPIPFILGTVISIP